MSARTMSIRPKRRVVAPLVALAVVVTAGFVVLDKGDDEEGDTYQVVATFTDASPIVAGNVVKASGVDVGTVSSVELKDGLAVVTMEVDRAVSPVHSDATAVITSKNLLGERFVALEPGTPDAPVQDGDVVIGKDGTRREVDLQEVLNTVDTPTAGALAALITTLGEGMRGRGRKTAKALAALTPAMEQSEQLAAILSDQNELLTSLIDNATPVARAVAGPHGEDLDHLVDSTTSALGAVAVQREAAEEMLQELPSTLLQARTTLSHLAGVAVPTTKTLRSLRPLTDDLEDVTRELQAFADAADPALASLQPVLDQGTALLKEAAPVVRALRPAGDDLVSVGHSARSLSADVLGSNLTPLMEFMKGWALATSDYDAVSHYFKAMLPLSPSPAGIGVLGTVPGIPDDPLGGIPLPDDPGLLLPDLPALPDLSGALGNLPGALGGLGGRNQGARNGDSGSATGLTSQQENSLLNQLLGGS